MKKRADYPIHPLFLQRCSLYAMSGQPMSDQELFPLFEAARFAPSSYNNQPWRFIYAHRETPQWSPLFDLLVDFNKEWCRQSAVLIVLLSSNAFASGKPARTHSFDTGAAWMSLALEGASRGYIVHGMEGFDYEKAYKVLEIPRGEKGYTVEAMAAIGKRGEESALPLQWKERENQVKPRKTLQEIAMLGHFRT
jgi:nitroreductase